jgi:hypothetical protein
VAYSDVLEVEIRRTCSLLGRILLDTNPISSQRSTTEPPPPVYEATGQRIGRLSGSFDRGYSSSW